MSLPMRIWRLSVNLHKKRVPYVPRILKSINFILFKNLLSFQCSLGENILLEHYGVGVMIHPNVKIGNNVKIWHGVTIASETKPGSDKFVVIGDGVTIGAGALIVAPRDEGLKVGENAHIGAGAVVTRDVEADSTVFGVPARPVFW